MTSKTSNQKHGQGQGAWQQGQGAWQQKKRPRQAVDNRQLCGAYNYRGCSESRSICSFAHKYSIWAGTLYYSTLDSSEQTIKGLKKNSWFPVEFQDLRLRNVNSLTEIEQLELIRLPLLSPSTTAPHGDSKRRKKATQAMQDGIHKELEVKLVDMENAANPTDDAESEVTRPVPTKQEREATLREQAHEKMVGRMLAATEIAMKAKPMRNVTEAEQQDIVAEEDASLILQLAALEEEFALAEGPCYMQQEKLESKDSQDDPVMNHRFGLVASGDLGVYRKGSECNESNKRHMGVLLRNLNEMLKDANGKDELEAASGYYACRFCSRSLYRSEARRKRIICACLRCISVLYCSDWCRFNDAKDHKFSCFMHPAWECQERTKPGVKAPADAEVPTIEATDDPKKGGQEASNDAQPEGAPPQDGEVQGDGEKTADDGDDDDGSKTAVDGCEPDA